MYLLLSIYLLFILAMDWNAKIDNFLKNVSNQTRTEYCVGKKKTKKQQKKPFWGGIAERSLQTISDRKSVLKIFVFIFLETPFVKYEVILLEKSSGCWGESHKNSSWSHFNPNQENRTRHYILHEEDEVYFNFVYNNSYFFPKVTATVSVHFSQ